MYTGPAGSPAIRERAVVRNGEAASTIPLGTPVAFTFSGTDDGLAVILPASSAAKSHAFAFGVALGNISAGQTGEVMVRGLVRKALMLIQTRAATSDSWSASTLSQGVLLNIDTVNNVFSTSGGTLAKTAYLPMGVLAESTTAAASATATSDTRTVITAYMKAFVRMM